MASAEMSVGGLAHAGVMTNEDLIQRARHLGADHAEADFRSKLHHRLHSGRDVATALGVTGVLDGEQYVALREAYSFGWSSWA